MSAPIVIVHGWSDNSSSFRKLAEFLRSSLGTEVAVIDLADWLSLNDEVTYRDLRRAMHEAWQAQPNLASAREVNVVTHSTGALVVRDWMTWAYETPSACPIKRLLMLAPANFGSPLAHKGTSFIARVFKGAKTGFQTGTNILSGLELASEYTWRLATKDILSPDPWYGADGILATVLVGNSGYSGLQGIVNEVGSDGTVRVSTANLNAAHATLSYDEHGGIEEYHVSTVAPKHQVAFGVLGGLNHGSITTPSAGTLHGDLIRDALLVQPAGYDAWRARLSALTDNLYDATESGDIYYHAYQNTVVRAYDDNGNPVEEYLVDFHGKRRSFLPTDLGFLFHQTYIYDVHNFKANSAYRCFYLDVTQICGNKKLQPDSRGASAELFLNVGPQPEFSASQPIGYSKTLDLPLDETARSELFQRNRTLLLDVTFPRKMKREKVFDIQPMR